MSLLALVPTSNRVVCASVQDEHGIDKTDFKPTIDRDGHYDYSKLIAFVQDGEFEAVLMPMGGPMPGLGVQLTSLGVAVTRIPWFKLEDLTAIKTGESAAERGIALLDAYELSADSFYTMTPYDLQMHFIREMWRMRYRLQTDFRQPAANQYAAFERDSAFLFGINYGVDGRVENLLDRTRERFARPAFVDAVKADEEALAKAITQLVESIPIWWLMHPDKFLTDSILPEMKGIGPSIGGGVLGEIGTIRRFPVPAALASYMRMLPKGNAMPARKKGEPSNWNDNGAQALWLWFSDQLVKQTGSIWNEWYYVRKLEELQLHPEVVEVPGTTRRGTDYVNYKYTLAHLDKMAKRWVGTRCIWYLHELWSSIDNDVVSMYGLGVDEAQKHAEGWYASSSYPGKLADVHRRYDLGAIKDRIEQLAAPRRRADPKAQEPDEFFDDDDENENEQELD